MIFMDPRRGEKAIPVWFGHEGDHNRRERVYEQLVEEFQGDKERFFSFFALSQDGALRPLPKNCTSNPMDAE
jgi:hypothetical protein